MINGYIDDFNIGDEVIVNGVCDGKKFVDHIGRIKKISPCNYFSFAIEFYKNIYGHDCDDSCKEYHGWYFYNPSTDPEYLIELALQPNDLINF